MNFTRPEVTANFKYADCAVISKKSKRTALQDTWKRRKLPKAWLQKGYIIQTNQDKWNRVYADNLLLHQYYVKTMGRLHHEHRFQQSCMLCFALVLREQFKRCGFQQMKQ